MIYSHTHSKGEIKFIKIIINTDVELEANEFYCCNGIRNQVSSTRSTKIDSTK